MAASRTSSAELLTSALDHAVVTVVDEGRGLVTVVRKTGGPEVRCEILAADEKMVELAPGDRVAMIPPQGGQQFGLILGRIGRCRLRSETAPSAPLSEEVVIEAARLLVLKCGGASITIRSDGKVLIKGTDVVSRAQRSNRIKGGSVAIN